MPSPKLQISYVSIADLKPYFRNQRLHTEDQVERIADSIREFGFVMPILLDQNNEIIAGHGRFQASEKLGLTEVPCLYAGHLTDDQVKAYRLADNRLQDLSYFDKQRVAQELTDLLDTGFDIFLTGFDDFDDLKLDEDDEELVVDERILPRMERIMDEHHDYLVFMFNNKFDWVRVCEEFKVGRVNASIMPDKTKIGVGRVLNGEKLLELLTEKNHSE